VAYDDTLWMGLPANTVVLPVANVLYIFKIRVWEVGTASAPEPTTSRRTPKSPAPPRPPWPWMHIQAHNVTTSLSDSARGPRSAYGLH